VVVVVKEARSVHHGELCASLFFIEAGPKMNFNLENSKLHFHIFLSRTTLIATNVWERGYGGGQWKTIENGFYGAIPRIWVRVPFYRFCPVVLECVDYTCRRQKWAPYQSLPRLLTIILHQPCCKHVGRTSRRKIRDSYLANF
jgi:hypothetical protein